MTSKGEQKLTKRDDDMLPTAQKNTETMKVNTS